MVEKQLIEAFPEHLRKEFILSLHSAYRVAAEEKKLFGSFSDRAGAYLKHFWSDAFLEKAAKSLKLDYRVELNAARNTPHLNIRSNNWQLTPHSLGNRKALNVAAYRKHLSRTNDLFEDHEDTSFAQNFSHGYVQLLHSGGSTLEAVSLSVPASSNAGIIYSEAMNIDVNTFINPEEVINDELVNKLRIRVEEQLKRSNE